MFAVKRLTLAAVAAAAATAAFAGSSSSAHAFGFVPTEKPTTIFFPFSKKVANIEFGFTGSGGKLIQYHNVSGVSNDRFWFEPAPAFGSDAYRIRPAHVAGQYLVPASSQEGAQIIQRPASQVGNSSLSVWHVESNLDGLETARHLRNHSTGYVMNVEGGSQADGARIIQYRPIFTSPFNDDVQVS